MLLADGGITFELLIPTTTQPPYPVVLVLTDEMGERRSLPYVDALLQAGIAVLEHLADDEDASPPSILKFDTAIVALLAADARLDANRVGVLGFGVGAQVAFRLAPGTFAARALLYPGCKALAQPIGHMAVDPLLLLYGGRDPANSDDTCTEAARLMAQSGRRVQRIRYPEAGYAWDHPAYGLEQRMLLPRSDGLGKVIVLAWPALAAMSAAQVAGFLGTALAPKGR